MMSSDAHRVQRSNGVYYSTQHTADTSLVNRRMFKRHLAQNTSYECTPAPTTSKPIEFRPNLSAAEYIDGRESYLKFGFNYSYGKYEGEEGKYVAKLSTGYLDFFDSITLRDRAGNVLEHINSGLNLILPIVLNNRMDQDIINASAVMNQSHLEAGRLYTAIIPLSFLLGFFNVGKLTPPHLIDGCVIQLGLRNANMVFRPTTTTNVPEFILGPPPDGADFVYAIVDPYIVTSNYVLDNKLHQLITQQYESVHGLHYPFISYTHTQYDIPIINFTQEISVNQTYSRAFKAIFCMDSVYNEGESSFWNAQVDNVRHEDITEWPFGEFRARIGDTRYPDTPVTTWEEAYHLFLCAWKTYRGGHVSIFSELDFREMRILCVDLCRGVIGKKSGQKINNHYPLLVQLTLDEEVAKTSVNPNFPVTGDVFNRRLRCFVEHERILMARFVNGSREHVVVA